MEQLGDEVGSILDTLGMIQMAVLLLLVLAMLAAIVLLVRRSDRREAEALAALGRRRGWAIRRQMAEGGKGHRIEVTPMDGAAWTCAVTRYRNTGHGGTVRTTEFVDPSARLASGTVIVGPGIPAKQAAAAATLLGGFDGMVGRLLSSTLVGEHLDDAGKLNVVAVPELAATSVLATPDACRDVVVDALAAPLSAWRQRHTEDKRFPILIAGTHSLRIRLRIDACAADLLEAFVDHALAVRAAIAHAV